MCERETSERARERERERERLARERERERERLATQNARDNRSAKQTTQVTKREQNKKAEEHVRGACHFYRNKRDYNPPPKKNSTLKKKHVQQDKTQAEHVHNCRK